MNGVIIYRGESKITPGRGIVVVATGLSGQSQNEKTGKIIQTWILPDENHAPMSDLVKYGYDTAVCGNCSQRPALGGGCYVTIGQAPQAILGAVNRYVYPQYPIEFTAKLAENRIVRLGSYGDPAAVPFELWEQFLFLSKSHRGYTHQWRTCDIRFRKYCMASVETEREAREAQAMGYRTFRVRTSVDSTILDNEIICPASKEGNYRRTCETCRACSGTGKNDTASGHSIAIAAHGSAYKVQRTQQIIHRKTLLELEMVN